MMLAIVIPYYKLSFFEETLQSLANQTDKRFMVYIGDDASPEKPLELLERYKSKINFIYHRFEKNLGGVSLVKQWGRCIDLSGNEEWLMILGDDDYIDKNVVATFYAHHDYVRELKIKVIRFATRVHEVDGTFSKMYTHPRVEKSTDFFYNKLFNRSRGSLSEQIFSREAYLEHKFRDFPLAWGSDDFAWLDFTNFGNIYTIDEALVYFRISTENISRKGYKDEIKNEARYLYFTLIIEDFLPKFKKEQRLKLLLYYEQLIYNLNKTSIYFGMLMCVKFLKEFELIQVIKFSRRVLIHQFKKWNS
jgi:glycosyltransferase involved in cell wall biosynthesis